MQTQEILEQLKKDDVQFVSLQFSDLLGTVKEIIIPAEEVKHALIHGIWFDGSSIEGFARIHESDLFLKPDTETYALIPWLTENGKTARIICNIHRPDGEPFNGDPRFILKKAIAEATEMGFQYNVGPELEFYLFKNDDADKKSLLDHGGYFDLSSHQGYKVLKETVTALKNFGIKVETAHHEVGQGQYEIDFNYGPALQIADRLLTLKYTVKKIAQMHNLHATFMPKPIMGAAGSGMHIHQSLFDIKTGRNAFYDENDKYKLSKIAYNFIASQMNHIKAMCAILCPTVNSYKRLVSGYEAPVYITWASMNRSALIRIPRWFNLKPESARIELRCPDPTCNPYLAFAVMLSTGLDGIKNNLTPPQPIEENVFKFNNEILEKKKIDVLSSSLMEALDEMKKDEIIKKSLGDYLFGKYIEVKTKEWDEFRIQVTSWEKTRYFDMY